MKLFLSPHNDDAILFGAFTILRERPLVLTIFDSHKQAANGGPTLMQRRREDEDAMAILGAPVMFAGISDVSPDAKTIEDALLPFFNQPEMVYAPAVEKDGHPHHNLVGEVAKRIFRNVTAYFTYTTHGKSTGQPVACLEADWPLKKLQALACYESQIRMANQRDHWLREQYEYYAA